MLTDDGPRVVEFNCRMGDPETQAILPLTRFDILALMRAVAAGEELPAIGSESANVQSAVATVVAAAGYPEHPRTGDVIHLPASTDGVHVFHAGTARNAAGELVTAGGRVLAVTAVGVGSGRRAACERRFCRSRGVRRKAVPDGHRVA